MNHVVVSMPQLPGRVEQGGNPSLKWNENTSTWLGRLWYTVLTPTSFGPLQRLYPSFRGNLEEYLIV